MAKKYYIITALVICLYVSVLLLLRDGTFAGFENMETVTETYRPEDKTVTVHTTTIDKYVTHTQTVVETAAPFADAMPDASGRTEKAIVVMLTREDKTSDIAETIRNFEERFNKRYHYPILILTETKKTLDAREFICKFSSGSCSVQEIPKEEYELPPRMTDERIENTVKKILEKENNDDRKKKGLSLQFNRYATGRFLWHPELAKYDYYMMLQPQHLFLCDVDYDPFNKIATEGKLYGFSIAGKLRHEMTFHAEEVIRKYLVENLLSPPDKEFYTWHHKGWEAAEMGEYCGFHPSGEVGKIAEMKDKLQKILDYTDKTMMFYKRYPHAHFFRAAAIVLTYSRDEIMEFREIGGRIGDDVLCPAKKTCVCTASDQRSHNEACAKKIRDLFAK